MANRIEQLTLSGFRGATCPVTIDFDKNKYAALIFGENGTGKSTIVDAIDFVCNGHYGSLTELSSTKPKSHIVALSSKPKDLKVVLSASDKAWAATLATGGAKCEGPNGKPAAKILRRSQLLKVVNAKPKDRYDALRDFIAVPNIQKCEDELREAVKTAKNDLEEATRAKAQAQTALERFWRDEGSPAKNAETWGRKRAAENVDRLKARLEESKQAADKIDAYIQASDSLEDAEETAVTAKESSTKAEEALRVAERAVSADSGKLIDVLEGAKVYLADKPAATACPVCEQPIKPTELANRITERLAQLDDLVAAKAEAKKRRSNLVSTEAVANSERKKLVSQAAKMAEPLRKATLSEVTGLRLDWALYSRLLDPKVSTDDPTKLGEAKSLRQTAGPLRDSIVSTRDALDTQIKQYNAIKGHVDTIDEKTKAATDFDRLYKRLAAIHKIVETERKAYVTSVLDAVSGTVESMYVRLHPDEDLGGVRLYLKPNVIGSLEFDAKFQTLQAVPPQAYYSESHLDTLGICVFLALAQHLSDDDTIVVLDDVVTSVDEAHMERFIQLLHDEADKFNQLVITTHYRPWRDRYKFARGPAANVQLIELLHWSIPRGVRHSRTKLSVEELRGHANAEPMDRQIVASKAGILLESLFDHLALLYRCKLPRQAEPTYTLGDLADCFGKKLRPALRAQTIDGNGAVTGEAGIGELVSQIGGIGWIRNQVGCHWNPMGMDVGDGEVRQFAERTIELAEILVCASCGELPRRVGAGTHWECGCRLLRLYPITNPDSGRSGVSAETGEA